MLLSEIMVHPQEIEQVVGSVFSTMTGLDPAPAADQTEVPAPASLMTAAVYLGGEWRGAVFVHCLPFQARAFAGRFLDMPVPETVDNDVRDVMGELANMIAGNLKCTLCPGIRISPPSVVEGSSYSMHLCGGRVVYRSGFETDQGPFWLTVFDARIQVS